MFSSGKNQWIASSLFFFSIVAISTSAIFAKFTIASPSVLSMYRLWIASIFLLPFVLNKKEEFVRLQKKEWLLLGGAGFFLAMHFWLWYGSLEFTSIASSTIILALQPIISLIGGFILFKDKVSFGVIMSMNIAIVGAMMIGWGDLGLSQKALFGDFLSFISVIMVVFYLLIGQKVVKQMSHWVYTFVVFVFAALTLTIVNLFLQENFLNYTSQDWWIFLCLALIPSLAMVIHNWLMNFVTATTISMGILGEPLGASALAFLLLDEYLTSSQLFGGMLVVVGVFFFLWIQNRTIKVTASVENIVSE